MAAYEQFLEARALYTGQPKGHLSDSISLDTFEALIDDLYRRYAAGDISIGRFSELIEIAHLELWEILELLELPLHA
jgi:hypothetical protein